MSREVRRVPLDFDWPLGEDWAGYNLWLPKCPDCKDEDGYSTGYVGGQSYAPGEECQTCDGHRRLATPEQRAILEVPVGEGWQVWETVSEGAPITPVFPTAEALIDWLVLEGCHSDPERTWERFVEWNPPLRRSAAEAFVTAGWAPSMIVEAWAWCAEADRVEPNQDRNHYHYTASVVDVEVPK